MAVVGSSRLLRFQTFDLDGKPRDADEVTLTINGGAPVVVAPAAGDNGDYEYLLELGAAGLWAWTWLTSDPGNAQPQAEADSVLVGGSRSAPLSPWCGVADVMRSPPLKKLADDNKLDLEVVARQCQAATEWLHERTWRRFRGLELVELRPCCQCSFLRSPAQMAGLLWPLVSAGTGDTVAPYDGPAPCGCSTLPEVLLPADTQTVDSVTIDGETFTAWRLDGRRLVRTDGARWPCCQNLAHASSEESTFAVNLVVGGEVYEVARTAAVELAAEFTLAIHDPASCRVPMKVNSVTRQGAVYTRVDTSTLKDGLPNLRACDIFLSQFGKQPKRMAMASPDVPPLGRRVGA